MSTRRQLTQIDRPRQSRLSLPLRVLLIVSRPADIGFIDPRNSIAPLLDALQALPPGQVMVDQCDPPTLKQLEQLISQARKDKHPYQIVHFDGHATYLPLTGIGALAYLAIGTVGASWPRWVRLAVFGAGYTVVMAVVQPFGMFPMLRWTEVLAPLPLLPVLAVAGGWLGSAAGRMMGRLTGDV